MADLKLVSPSVAVMAVVEDFMEEAGFTVAAVDFTAGVGSIVEAGFTGAEASVADFAEERFPRRRHVSWWKRVSWWNRLPAAAIA